MGRYEFLGWDPEWPFVAILRQLLISQPLYTYFIIALFGQNLSFFLLKWHFAPSFKETLAFDANCEVYVSNNSRSTISGKWFRMTSDSLCSQEEGRNTDVEQKNDIIVKDVSVSVSSL